MNVLTRRGDIELGDYIQPNHQYYPDLLESPPQIYDRFSNYISYNDRFSNYISYNGDRVPSYYTGQHAPSYQSGGNPPSFNTIDWINCPLEDYINLEIILLVFIFLCFLILWIMRNHPWFNNFIKRFLLIHPLEIRILWIVLTAYFINKLLFNYSLYSMSVLIPFSVFNIDFRDSFEWKINSYWVKPKISYLKIQTLTKDIANLLDSIEDKTDFSMSLFQVIKNDKIIKSYYILFM